MSVCGSSLESARHWTTCWRTRPVRGRFRSQSAWSGRKGCVLNTTRRASTPRLRSACTFVHPTPARLTGQCVTRSVTSGGREEELDAVPTRDLAAVALVEVGVDGVTAERSRDLRLLRPAEDLGAGLILRHRGERVVHDCKLRAGALGIGQRPAVGAIERPGL